MIGAPSRVFQSTPSGGKATWDARRTVRFVIVSIHAFRGEGDGVGEGVGEGVWAFQSTPSGGKATYAIVPGYYRNAFQSTPSGGKAT